PPSDSRSCDFANWVHHCSTGIQECWWLFAPFFQISQFVDTIQRSARLWSLTGDQVFLPSKAPFFAPIPLNYSNLRSHPLACKGEGVLEGGTPPRAVRNYFDRLCRTAWCCKAKLNHSELAPL